MSVVAITGANRGIGLALCHQLSVDHEVHALCRHPSPELEALGVHIHAGVDVCFPQSIPLEELPSIDILINNAGILHRDSLDALDTDSLMEQFRVNAIGPLCVTQALVPKLSSGSKVAIVTSRMGSVTDNTSGGMYGYRMSKSAVNMAGMSLAQDLKTLGISVALLHPGFVRTDMTGGNGYISAAESAQGLIAQIMRMTLENTGSFWHCNGEELPW